MAIIIYSTHILAFSSIEQSFSMNMKIACAYIALAVDEFIVDKNKMKSELKNLSCQLNENEWQTEWWKMIYNNLEQMKERF